MTQNLYLSDDLYVELDLDRVYLNTYFNYTISRRDIYIEGEEVIYSGRFYDKKRTAYLESVGLTVLRFSNLDISKNFRGVCEQIDMVVRNRLNSKV